LRNRLSALNSGEGSISIFSLFFAGLIRAVIAQLLNLGVGN